MKKAICLLLAMLLLCTCALAEGYEGPTAAAMQLNPNGYDRIMVTDIFSNTDEGINSGICVQGCFGTIGLENEAEPEFVGFDPEETVTLGLAEGCMIFMPEDVLNPVSNVLVEDLEAWYALYGQGNTFYAEFEIDENGNLAYLAFIYYSFN